MIHCAGGVHGQGGCVGCENTGGPHVVFSFTLVAERASGDEDLQARAHENCVGNRKAGTKCSYRTGQQSPGNIKLCASCNRI